MKRRFIIAVFALLVIAAVATSSHAWLAQKATVVFGTMTFIMPAGSTIVMPAGSSFVH